MKKYLFLPLICCLALTAGAQQQDADKAMVQSFLTGLYDKSVGIDDLYRRFVQQPGDTTGEAAARQLFGAYVETVRKDTATFPRPALGELKANFTSGKYRVTTGEAAGKSYPGNHWPADFWNRVYIVQDAKGDRRLTSCMVKKGRISSFIAFMKGGHGPYFLQLSEPTPLAKTK